MSQPPGPNQLDALRENLRSQIAAELRKEIGAGFQEIRDEISKSTVARAEQHSGYMRNWLAILTLTITIAFVVFGILGWTRFSDISAARKEMTDQAAEVKILVVDVQAKAKTINDSVASIQTAKARIDDLDSRMKTTDSKVTAASQRISDIEKRSEDADRQIVAAVNRTSQVAQQTSSNFQSSINSGILGNFPSILSATFAQKPAQSTIRGSRLGDSKGRLYVEVQRSPFSAALAQLETPTRLDINPQYTKWADDEIDFVLSDADYQSIKDARAKSLSTSSVTGAGTTLTGITLSEGANSSYLDLVVETSDGRRSFSSPLTGMSVAWP